MKNVVILGYASLDHVIALDGPAVPGQTTRITERREDAWNRMGGAPWFIARILEQAGSCQTVPVTWIGDDRSGEYYLSAMKEIGASTAGIRVIPGGRTPVTLMVYEPSGEAICLYDPLPAAGDTRPSLEAGHRDLIAQADWLVLTIAPADATLAALENCRSDAKVAWVAKKDAHALPPHLLERIVQRADIIFCSETEGSTIRDALAGTQAKPDLILVETYGRRGSSLEIRGERTLLQPPATLPVLDPCGAGDTLAAGTLSCLIRDAGSPEAALRQGMQDAYHLLSQRQNSEEKE